MKRKDQLDRQGPPVLPLLKHRHLRKESKGTIRSVGGRTELRSPLDSFTHPAESPAMMRRDLIKAAATASALAPFGAVTAWSQDVPDLQSERPESGQQPGDTTATDALPPADAAFLDDLQRRTYRYFLDAADPRTGLVADRGARDGSGMSEIASSASCGFALAAHAIAPRAGLATHSEAAARTHQLLHSLLTVAENERGFVYHFIGRGDGRRRMGCEASSVDTALMLAGAMCAHTAFSDDLEIQAMADELIARVDWQWMLGEGNLLHMGWTPEEGLIPHQWDRFSELTILVLMAIGAPNRAIPPECWTAWRRDKALTLDGETFLSYPPLFVHQYPMSFFDFRYVRSPSGRDYHRNSVTAHHAQIRFLNELAARYPEQLGHYGDDLWGITSSDSADGYRDWGGPYEDNRIEPDRGIDGTIVPSAAAGGLAIVPDQALHTLRYQREHFGDRVYGRYGFANAFNPATGWVSRDVIGIDTGISLLAAENLRRDSVWDLFMQHPVAINALDRVGFVSV